MVQVHIIVKYTCITDVPRVIHEITFTSNWEAIKFLRDHSRWFAQTDVRREARVEKLSFADMIG